jgi:hypothetical protein
MGDIAGAASEEHHAIIGRAGVDGRTQMLERFQPANFDFGAQ